MTMYTYEIKDEGIHGTVIVANSANANHIADAINEALSEKLATPNNIVLSHAMPINALAIYDTYGDTFTGASYIE